MAVKLRLMRLGRRHRPFFRINAIDSRAPRNGRIIEKLGHYDPIEKDPQKQVVLNRERVQYWLDKGAIPSDTVSQILLRHGIKNKYAEETSARRARAKQRQRQKPMQKPMQKPRLKLRKKQRQTLRQRQKPMQKPRKRLK
jgi:small subunit ribosomal protein S16